MGKKFKDHRSWPQLSRAADTASWFDEGFWAPVPHVDQAALEGAVDQTRSDPDWAAAWDEHRAVVLSGDGADSLWRAVRSWADVARAEY